MPTKRPERHPHREDSPATCGLTSSLHRYWIVHLRSGDDSRREHRVQYRQRIWPFPRLPYSRELSTSFSRVGAETHQGSSTCYKLSVFPTPTYCDVALPVPLDAEFTYRVNGAVPVVGGRVLVPFREKRMSGIVTRLHDEAPDTKIKTRDVLQVLDAAPVLDEKLIELGRWIAQYYIAPIGEVLRTMLPLSAEFKQAVGYRITERGSEALFESATVGSSRRSQKDAEHQLAEYAVLDYLADGELMREQAIRSATGATREVLRTLAQKKWIAREDLSGVRDARRTVKWAVLTSGAKAPS